MNPKLKAEREKCYEESLKVDISRTDYKEAVSILNEAYRYFKQNFDEEVYSKRLGFVLTKEQETALRELAAKPKYRFDIKVVRFFNITSWVKIHIEKDGFTFKMMPFM